MKRLLLPCLLFACIQLSAQTFQNIMISDVAQPEEISICISPNDTNIVAAGANINAAYNSADGGYTWNSQFITDPYGVWGDPCVVADTAGNFYYFHLADDTAIIIWPMYCDKIILQKSTDGGATFDPTSYTGYNLPKMQDKAWAAVDPATNYCAVSWTQFDWYGTDSVSDSSRIYFSISKNAGADWSTPVVLSSLTGDCLDSSLTDEGAVPAFGSPGVIYDVWSRSDTLYMNKSTDTGNTWLTHEIAITPETTGWYYDVAGLNRCNGLPVTIVDHSNSPYNGNIYVNWTDKRNGRNDADVFFIKSSDGGNTWTQALRVNNDPPGKENFMSAMTVDEVTGDIYILFYDRRNYNDSTTDVYLAYSFDGGSTFANTKVSNTPFLPDASQFFGDYIGISAVNGCVRAAWMRMDEDQCSVWVAPINKSQLPAPPPDTTTAINTISFSDEFVLASTNPAKTGCVIHYSGNQPYRVTITDLSGQVVFTKQTTTESLNCNLTNPSLASGTYLVNCVSKTTEKTFKLVLMR